MVMETCKSQVYIEAIKDRYRHQNHPLSWQKQFQMFYILTNLLKSGAESW